MIEFDEYEFLDWCGEQYLEGLGQDDAHVLQRNDGVRDAIRALPPYDLIILLGKYLSRKPAASEG